MANQGKLLTLREVLQHELKSEDEYNKRDSTDESSEEEYEPYERVPMLFVDEENIETIRYETVVSKCTCSSCCCDVMCLQVCLLSIPFLLQMC